jgi:hypothetical protein
MSEHSKPEQSESVGWLCPACGAGMHPARLLKGYDQTDYDPDRRTCALHGPLGRFRHIASDRKGTRK